MGTLIPTSLCALMERGHLGWTGVSRGQHEHLREPKAQPTGLPGARPGRGEGVRLQSHPPSRFRGDTRPRGPPSPHEGSLALPTPSLSSREAASQAKKFLSEGARELRRPLSIGQGQQLTLRER